MNFRSQAEINGDENGDEPKPTEDCKRLSETSWNEQWLGETNRDELRRTDSSGNLQRRADYNERSTKITANIRKY